MTGHAQESTIDEAEIREALRAVMDPEAGMNIVDLGLVYGIEATGERVVVDMTMTSPACPLGEMITDDARAAVRDVVGPNVEIDVRLVWDPPWSPEMMSDHAKERFGWS